MAKLYLSFFFIHKLFINKHWIECTDHSLWQCSGHTAIFLGVHITAAAAEHTNIVIWTTVAGRESRSSIKIYAVLAFFHMNCLIQMRFNRRLFAQARSHTHMNTIHMLTKNKSYGMPARERVRQRRHTAFFFPFPERERERIGRKQTVWVCVLISHMQSQAGAFCMHRSYILCTPYTIYLFIFFLSLFSFSHCSVLRCVFISVALYCIQSCVLFILFFTRIFVMRCCCCCRCRCCCCWCCYWCRRSVRYVCVLASMSSGMRWAQWTNDDANVSKMMLMPLLMYRIFKCT